MITQEKLKELLDYDPSTGIFTWKIDHCNKIKSGHKAGNKTKGGYIKIVVMKKMYTGHRLAWLFIHGHFPEKGYVIDHINGICDDNRISNLRCVSTITNQENRRKASANSTTGFLGVTKAVSGRFHASIKANAKAYHLGTFDTAEEAYDAYLTAKRKLHIGNTL